MLDETLAVSVGHDYLCLTIPYYALLQVLQAVASALTHSTCKSHSHSELLSLISSEPPCRQLYVLLHNIDGPGG